MPRKRKKAKTTWKPFFAQTASATLTLALQERYHLGLHSAQRDPWKQKIYIPGLGPTFWTAMAPREVSAYVKMRDQNCTRTVFGYHHMLGTHSTEFDFFAQERRQREAKEREKIEKIDTMVKAPMVPIQETYDDGDSNCAEEEDKESAIDDGLSDLLEFGDNNSVSSAECACVGTCRGFIAELEETNTPDEERIITKEEIFIFLLTAFRNPPLLK